MSYRPKLRGASEFARQIQLTEPAQGTPPCDEGEFTASCPRMTPDELMAILCTIMDDEA